MSFLEDQGDLVSSGLGWNMSDGPQTRALATFGTSIPQQRPSRLCLTMTDP